MNAIAPPVRTRSRRISMEAPSPAHLAMPTVQPGANPARVLAEQKLSAFWIANTASNAATREAERLKKELEAALVAGGFDTLTHTVVVGNATVPVTATIGDVEETYIDVAILRRLVQDDTFLKIVTASKKAVTDEAGTNVAVAAESVRTKPGKLTVKKAS